MSVCVHVCVMRACVCVGEGLVCRFAFTSVVQSVVGHPGQEVTLFIMHTKLVEGRGRIGNRKAG